MHHESGKTPVWKYVLRGLLVVYVLSIKFIPLSVLEWTRELWVRIVFGLAVIYLAYCDIMSAMLLAVAFFLSAQDFEQRAPLSSVIPAALAAAKSHPTQNHLYLSGAMGQQTWLDSKGADAAHRAYVEDKVEPGTQYIKDNMGQHADPATRTMSENIDLKASGYVTEKNLLDAQINSAQGADVDVPCIVESITGSYNAQGLGTPMPLGPDNCVYSRV